MSHLRWQVDIEKQYQASRVVCHLSCLLLVIMWPEAELISFLNLQENHIPVLPNRIANFLSDKWADPEMLL